MEGEEEWHDVGREESVDKTWGGEEVAWRGQKQRIRRRHIVGCYEMCLKCLVEKENEKNRGRQVDPPALH